MALTTESYWTREIEPPALAKLTADLRAHYGVTKSLIGCKGDVNHLRGYHRSREWILNSAYSRDGSADYSVRSSIDRSGDARWLCAMDFQTKGGVPELIEICKRVDAAVRADLLPQVREWYGNVDGDQVVDGWDNLVDRAASSDTSHLWHLHISFFRSRADWDHTLLFSIIAGVDMKVLVRKQGETTVWIGDGVTRRLIDGFDEFKAVTAAIKAGLILAKSATVTDVQSLAPYGADVDERPAPAPVTMTDADRAAIAGQVAELLKPTIEAVPAATAELVHADLAD